MGIDPHEKLLRSQGALFVYMKQSKNLKNILLDQYKFQKSKLSFVLGEESDEK